ncbi:MAG: hypothetical protein KF723_17695 [Rhizobiaceae bacterium]|nr:hypothetical protein [Rhizobiaceae bacterium]
MKFRLTRTLQIVATATVPLAFVGAIALAATNTERPKLDPIPNTPAPERTLAELAFPDAPYGVDPVVTGPRSAALRARQDGAGCAEAVWPNVPVDCYPD